MSIFCNTVAALDETQMEAKVAVARAATTATLGAISDCFKAAEALHAKRAAGPEGVYLHSANTKLDTAMAAFVRNREILGSVEPKAEALGWLQNLDYDKLYYEGVRNRMIPASQGQWSRLVDIISGKGYLGVVDVLICDVEDLRHAVNVLIETAVGEANEAPTSDVPAALTILITALSDFASFAQMVAYVNRLTPLDPAWVKAALPMVGSSV